ncbi:MAG: peptidyl-prolyl cis-trans isomerase [Steroidobacteraceae bacterium]
MLQKIGDSLKGRKTVAWLILIPLAIVFAIWGATGAVSLDLFGPQTYAVKVNGSRIELKTANDAWQSTQSEWQQQVGTDIPEDLRTSLQTGVLERLIRQQLLSDRSRDEGYRVTADRIQEAIRGEQAFQVEGQYSETLALARLAQIGVTADQYRADIRQNLQNEELQRALFVSEFATPTEIGRRLALEDEQREVRIVNFPLERYRVGVRVSEADLAAWFEKNSKRFLTTESVRLQYAEGSLAEVQAAITITEADLQSRYAENKDRYASAERRQARHILVASQKEAEGLLKRAQAGEDFLALARQFSKDTGSAASGGDLGLAEKSTFVGPFAEAVFAMKVGELRGPVKTEFGFHVIRLEAIEAGRVRAYEEVRAELEDEFRRDRAADLFGEKQEQAQRRIEQSGADLAVIAKDLGLTLKEIATFERGSGAAALGAAADLDGVVFGDAVLNQRRIGGPIAVGDERFVLVKVLEHRKPAVPPLASIRVQVLEAVTRERAGEAARAAAEALAKQVAGGATVSEAARFVDRRDPSLTSELREAVFAMPRPKAGKPEVRTVPLSAGGASLVVLSSTRVVPNASEGALRALRVQQIVTRQAQGSVASYVEDLRGTAEVKTNPQAFQ